MADYTHRLGLIKPTPDEMVDIQAQINANSDILDVQAGAFVCTSTTRPFAPYPGQQIFETDTGFVLFWNGTKWRIVADYLWVNRQDFGRLNMRPEFNPTNGAENGGILHKLLFPAPPLDIAHSATLTVTFNGTFNVPANSFWDMQIGATTVKETYNNESSAGELTMGTTEFRNEATGGRLMKKSTTLTRLISQADITDWGFIGVKIRGMRSTGSGNLNFMDDYGYCSSILIGLNATSTVQGTTP